MPLDAKQRRELVARAHPLKPIVHVGRQGVQPSQIEEIRAHLRKVDLVKVRVEAATGDECDAIAGEIAEAVPCELVARRGFVLILQADDNTGDDD